MKITETKTEKYIGALRIILTNIEFRYVRGSNDETYVVVFLSPFTTFGRDMHIQRLWLSAASALLVWRYHLLWLSYSTCRRFFLHYCSSESENKKVKEHPSTQTLREDRR